MVLWQKRRQKMGNTMLSRDAWFQVGIAEKHDTYCIASWNGNPARRMYRREVEKLYRERPAPKAKPMPPIPTQPKEAGRDE